jgi:hypothetical protein
VTLLGDAAFASSKRGAYTVALFVILQTAGRVLHEYFSWATTTTMSSYPDDADDVPKDLRIPLWSWNGLQA